MGYYPDFTKRDRPMHCYLIMNRCGFLCSKFYFIIVEYRSLVIVRKLNLEYVIKQTNQKSLYIFAHLLPCVVAMLLYRWHWLSVSIMQRSSFIYYIMQLAMNTFSKEFPPNAVVKSDSDD